MFMIYGLLIQELETPWTYFCFSCCCSTFCFCSDFALYLCYCCCLCFVIENDFWVCLNMSLWVLKMILWTCVEDENLW